MKYYVPIFELGVLCPLQDHIEDKFGGLPWGLPQRSWPICKNCGKSMGLVAQLLHDDERLNLGRNGRCLFVFKCCNADSMCVETWDSETGGNSSFILEPEELGSGLVFPPDIEDPDSAEIRTWHHCAGKQWNPEKTIWIETEVRIREWEPRDDGISESMRSSFMHEAGDIDEELISKLYEGTKLGSVPAWVQAPEYDNYRFVGQFAPYFGFMTPIPDPDEVGCLVYPVYMGTKPRLPKVQRFDVPREISRHGSGLSDDDPVWVCGGPNYGDAGCGYLFIKDRRDSLPQCEFIWQCH